MRRYITLILIGLTGCTPITDGRAWRQTRTEKIAFKEARANRAEYNRRISDFTKGR